MSITASPNGKEIIVGTQSGFIYRVIAASLDNMILAESHTNAI